MELGMCLDIAGNDDGQIQVKEIEALVDTLAEEEIISADTHAAVKAEKPENGDEVVEAEDAAMVVEAMLIAEGVPREDWADVVQATADECWDRVDAAQGPPPSGPPSGASTGSGQGSGTSGADVVQTALAQLRASNFGR